MCTDTNKAQRNWEFEHSLSNLNAIRLLDTTHKSETHFALTCIGSCVSLIGPTHSSVAETCTQWATISGLKQTQAQRHQRCRHRPSPYHYTVNVQEHIGMLSYPSSNCQSCTRPP